MPVTTLTRGALNRALLARQLLLAREKVPVLKAIERLVALQAQLAKPPFLGLWSRLEGFQREDLTRLLHARKVVRATSLRGTLHLMTAKDYVSLRAALQPVLTEGMRGILKDRTKGLDVDRLVKAARAYFEEEPRTFEELRDHLMALEPDGDERAMGFAVRMHLPLVQVPTEEAEWGYPGTTDFAVAETWLGEPLGTDGTPHALVLRHLAAFGPATAADVQAWSGLGGLKGVLDELRPKLREFKDERGRTLFDLPKAPRPPEDTPAPVRFIPDFDSLLLGHDDRTRIVEDAYRKRLATKNLRVLPTLLVDGFVAGTWAVERKRGTATLSIELFETVSKKTRAELTEEGEALLRFSEGDARAFEVHFA